MEGYGKVDGYWVGACIAFLVSYFHPPALYFRLAFACASCFLFSPLRAVSSTFYSLHRFGFSFFCSYLTFLHLLVCISTRRLTNL